MLPFIVNNWITFLLIVAALILVIFIAVYYIDWNWWDWNWPDWDFWPFNGELEFSVKKVGKDEWKIKFPVIEENPDILASACDIFVSWAQYEDGKWKYSVPAGRDYSVGAQWDDDNEYLTANVKQPSGYSVARIWAKCGSEYIAPKGDYVRPRLICNGYGQWIDPDTAAYEFVAKKRGIESADEMDLPYRFSRCDF